MGLFRKIKIFGFVISLILIVRCFCCLIERFVFGWLISVCLRLFSFSKLIIVFM